MQPRDGKPLLGLDLTEHLLKDWAMALPLTKEQSALVDGIADTLQKRKAASIN